MKSRKTPRKKNECFLAKGFTTVALCIVVVVWKYYLVYVRSAQGNSHHFSQSGCFTATDAFFILNQPLFCLSGFNHSPLPLVFLALDVLQMFVDWPSVKVFKREYLYYLPNKYIYVCATSLGQKEM